MEHQRAAHFNITGLTFCDGDKLRKIAIVIQSDMKLDGTFC